MSAEGSHLPDANPGSSDLRMGVQEEANAIRLGIGLCTVDIVSAMNGLLAVVGDGVGSLPATAKITPATVAVFLDLADVVDERTAFETGAWPLTQA